MNRTRKFIEDLKDPETKAGKALATVKDGQKLLESLGVNFNTLAEWSKLTGLG